MRWKIMEIFILDFSKIRIQNANRSSDRGIKYRVMKSAAS